MESIKGALQQRDERTIPQQWYIWYTQPRAEKQLQKRLAGEGIEVFLPLRKELHQWSDRKKWVEVPLFRGYLFTKISMRKFEATFLRRSACGSLRKSAALMVL
jgi:transcription antitermination factor NusG